jgi:outer membrane protein assembly factor BamB
MIGPSGARVFVTGTGLADGWSGMVTVAYDAATGAELWNAASGGSGHAGSGTGIASSPSGGRVFVSGSTDDGRFTTMAYGASTGTQLWARHLAGHRSDVHADAALAVAVSSDGGSVFVTGAVLDTKDQVSGERDDGRAPGERRPPAVGQTLQRRIGRQRRTRYRRRLDR